MKRWCKCYYGTWESLKERFHRPKSHLKQHTKEEEKIIIESVKEAYFRYGWDGAYTRAKEAGYTRSYSGFIYAAKRLGLCVKEVKKQKSPFERAYKSLHCL